MKIKLFSNYHSSIKLNDRFKKNYDYGIEEKKRIALTTGEDYNVAVIFNSTSEIIKKNALKVTIIQEPHNFAWCINNRFISDSDYVFLHDLQLFPDAKNAIEFPSIMFYNDVIDSKFFHQNHTYKKKKKLSFVVSSKHFLEGHGKRLLVLDEILQSDLDIDIYGKGLQDIMIEPDSRYKGEIKHKYNALIDYEYSLCFENSYEKNYLTEKFIDACICNTIPIYSGAPNCGEIYNNNGFINLDIESDNIVDRIKEIVETYNGKFTFYNDLNKERYFGGYNLHLILNLLLV